MSFLKDKVHIARRFQRSVNICADIGDQNALTGFICSQSSQQLLEQLARHVYESGQGAFIWTGPYGSGKSSLAVALASILCGNKKRRQINAEYVGLEFAQALWGFLPPKSKGWKVIPIVGQRENPIAVLGEAIESSPYQHNKPMQWTATKIVSAVKEISSQDPGSSGGLILFIDEMGKFLEAAARDDHDVFLFQELAEVASRSKGRLILIGVLHQSFQEYANRLSRELRDEWSKIQGRYVDLIVDATGQEQLELISKAIESDKCSFNDKNLVNAVSTHAFNNTGVDANVLGALLEACWPLHPTVASLLGPISRRRFGQNQRSIFGFLNSAEPHAFKEFLARAKESDLYYPEDLWDYLRANLEPSIIASPDGHRWSMAVEAIERCEGLSDDEITIKTLKCISLIDLFKERSGLRASNGLVQVSVRHASPKQIKQALSFLKKNSLVVYRKFQKAYGVYAGSDFDIETEVEKARGELSKIKLDELYKVADIHPLLAKRHYHKTGALRWFDVAICSVNSAESEVDNFNVTAGSVGQILLVIPTNGESTEEAARSCQEAARKANNANVMVGLPENGYEVGQLAVDLIAINAVRNNNPELAGDSVARREISSRLAALQQILAEAIQLAFETATWYLKYSNPRTGVSRGELNKWISSCCDHWFKESPIIKNELLNRRQPSNNAIAAQNQLLRSMVTKKGDSKLGIQGFPAEASLLHSLLIRTGLYGERKGSWVFTQPNKSHDHARILPAFFAAFNHLKENRSSAICLSEIYTIWRARPFGIAEGLMPVLAVAFLLSHSKSIAFYRDGLFRPEIIDLDVEILAKEEKDIQLRWMDLTGNSKKLLSGLATIIQRINPHKKLIHLQPIDVALELVAIHDALPGWVKRTQKLSSISLQVRRLLNQARDPNQFLFRDLPGVLKRSSLEFENQNVEQLIKIIGDSVLEMTSAYLNLLSKIKNLLLEELDVPNTSNSSLSELRERAQNIQDISGDFRIEAFCKRIAEFDGSDKQIEAIASMAANKPTHSWVDQDVQKAQLEMAVFCRAFCRAESFAHVHGRADKRQAMSVVVGIDGRQRVFKSDFEVREADRETIDQLSKGVRNILDSVKAKNINIALATLAEITAEYLNMQSKPSKKSKKGKVA